MKPEIDTDFANRLLRLIGTENKAAFARRCGFTDGALKAYLKGGKPSVDKALAIADACGVSLRWLATGEEPMRTGQTSGDPDFTSVNYYDVATSADGRAVVDSENTKASIAFRSDWLREAGLDPKQLNVILVMGDSMEPSLYGGDIILIDKRESKPRSGGVYALNYEGNLLVKRLQLLLNGGFKIISDNSRYDPEIVADSQMERVRIIGRVVWKSGMMP